MTVDLQEPLETTSIPAPDSKSGWGNSQCGFKSHLRHSDDSSDVPASAVGNAPEVRTVATASKVTEVVRSRIRALMKENGISQNELARRAGLTSPAMTYFFGGGDLMLNTLGKLSASLMVKPEELVRVPSVGSSTAGGERTKTG